MWLTPTQAAAEMINTSWCDLVCNAGAIKTRLLIDNGSKKPEMPAVDYFIRRGSKVAATGRTIWFNYAFACNWGISQASAAAAAYIFLISCQFAELLVNWSATDYQLANYHLPTTTTDYWHIRLVGFLGAASQLVGDNYLAVRNDRLPNGRRSHLANDDNLQCRNMKFAAASSRAFLMRSVCVLRAFSEWLS